MRSKHEVEIKPPGERPRMPEVLAASCRCGWTGPPRTGRNARSLARADGAQHVERTEPQSER